MWRFPEAAEACSLAPRLHSPAALPRGGTRDRATGTSLFVGSPRETETPQVGRSGGDCPLHGQTWTRRAEAHEKRPTVFGWVFVLGMAAREHARLERYTAPCSLWPCSRAPSQGAAQAPADGRVAEDVACSTCRGVSQEKSCHLRRLGRTLGTMCSVRSVGRRQADAVGLIYVNLKQNEAAADLPGTTRRRLSEAGLWGPLCSPGCGGRQHPAQRPAASVVTRSQAPRQGSKLEPAHLLATPPPTWGWVPTVLPVWLAQGQAWALVGGAPRGPGC